MDVQTFVTKTLNQISEGVLDAQNKSHSGALINPSVMTHGTGMREIVAKDLLRSVEFDVAVTVSDSAETKGDIGVVSESDASSQRSISRIKFTVPIFLPIQNK